MYGHCASGLRPTIRRFVIGSALPVALVATIDFYVFPAFLPGPRYSWLHSRSTVPAQLVPLILLILALAIHSFQHQVLLFFEGYWWKNSLLGRLLLKRQRQVLKRARVARLTMRNLVRYIRRRWPEEEGALAGLVQGRLTLAHLLNTYLPDSPDSLLPTRLGNVIQSSLRYSFVAYGMDVTAVWPRLVPSIPSRCGTLIDEMRTSIEAWVNCCLLSLMSIAWFILLYASHSVSGISAVVHCAMLVIVLFTGASVSYEVAIDRAVLWGAHVRAAIDL